MDLDGDGLIFSGAEERNIKLVYEDGKTTSEDNVLTMSAFDLKKNSVVYYLLVGNEVGISEGFDGLSYTNIEVITSEQKNVIDKEEYIEFSNVPADKKNVENTKQMAINSKGETENLTEFKNEGERTDGLLITKLTVKNDDDTLLKETLRLRYV